MNFFVPLQPNFKKRINNHTILNIISFTKNTLTAIVLFFTMTSCQRGDTHAVTHQPVAISHQPSATQSLEISMDVERAVVLERVRDIYRLIRSEYVWRGYSFDNDLFDKSFCTKSWNKLLMAVRCKEEQTGTLFFEVNYWSMTRYPGIIPTFDEFEIRHLDMLSDQKRASVSFTVYEEDTYTPASIDLVFEDGQWKIDNFHNLRYMINARSAMLSYVANTNVI